MTVVRARAALLLTAAWAFLGGLLAVHLSRPHESRTGASAAQPRPQSAKSGDAAEVLRRLDVLERGVEPLTASMPDAPGRREPPQAATPPEVLELEAVRQRALRTIDGVLDPARSAAQRAQTEEERTRAAGVLAMWESTRRSVEGATTAAEIGRHLEGIGPVRR